MSEPPGFDPDVDDLYPFPHDVESARAWALPPIIRTTPPFYAWWCPACQRLQQHDLPLHWRTRAEDPTPGAGCPATGVCAVRLVPRPPVAPGPGLPLAGWWCPTCRYLVPDPHADHPAELARPLRLPGCVNTHYRSIMVESGEHWPRHSFGPMSNAQ